MSEEAQTKIMDTQQAAKYLQVSGARIRQLAKSKQIPAFKIGNAWCFDYRDIKRFQKVSPGRPSTFSLVKELRNKTT